MPWRAALTPVTRVAHAWGVSGWVVERRTPPLPSRSRRLRCGRWPSAMSGSATSSVAESRPMTVRRGLDAALTAPLTYSLPGERPRAASCGPRPRSCVRASLFPAIARRVPALAGDVRRRHAGGVAGAGRRGGELGAKRVGAVRATGAEVCVEDVPGAQAQEERVVAGDV